MTGSDQADEKLLPIYEWLKQQHERAVERLADLESGTWTIGSIVDGQMVDETAQEIESRKREIAQTEQLMGLYEKASGKPG